MSRGITRTETDGKRYLNEEGLELVKKILKTFSGQEITLRAGVTRNIFWKWSTGASISLRGLEAVGIMEKLLSEDGVGETLPEKGLEERGLQNIPLEAMMLEIQRRGFQVQVSL